MKKTKPSSNSQPVYLQVAADVRTEILSGRLAPGESLPTERDLAVAHGASRATVREALRSLQAEGLVVAGGGAPLRATVADSLDRPARDALINILRLKRVDLADLIDLRSVLEAAAMRRAAERGDLLRFEEARQAVERMARPGVSIEEFDDADVRFHVALVRASGNEAMHLMMLALRDPVAEHLFEALLSLDDPSPALGRIVAEHRQILEAVSAGDGEAAAALVERHIRGFYPTSEEE